MKLHLSLISKLYASLVLVTLAPSWSFAVPEDSPLVEVHYSQDQLADYKDRRGNHGAYFGVQYEVLQFKNYMSPLDNMIYKDIFGDSDIPLIRVNLNYKYNFMLGSLALGADVGTGSVGGLDSGRKLDVTKYGVNAQFTLDNMMDEPFIAPYVGINVWNIYFDESRPTGSGSTESFSGTTQLGFNYMIGALIQLNWLDYDSAKSSRFEIGLENTFLDVYVTQYATTESPEDPNTETDLSYGAGLRLEF